MKKRLTNFYDLTKSDTSKLLFIIYYKHDVNDMHCLKNNEDKILLTFKFIFKFIKF